MSRCHVNGFPCIDMVLVFYILSSTWGDYEGCHISDRILCFLSSFVLSISLYLYSCDEEIVPGLTFKLPKKQCRRPKNVTQTVIIDTLRYRDTFSFLGVWVCCNCLASCIQRFQTVCYVSQNSLWTCLWDKWQVGMFVCLFWFNVVFNNFSVMLRRCLVATGSSMLFFFIVLPHWSIMPQTLGMIPHQVKVSWHWVDQLFARILHSVWRSRTNSSQISNAFVTHVWHIRSIPVL